MRALVLASFLPFWVLVIYILNKWPKNGKHSFSMHGAASKRSYRFYAPVVAYCGISYFVFNVLWYIDNLKLGLVYTVCMHAISFLQVLFAVVPDNPKKPSMLHRNAANLWGVLLLLTFIITLYDAPLNRVQIFSILATLVIMSFCALRIFGALEKHEHYLRFQLIGIAIIHTGIISLTYLT
ncbi:MAG TPA: hypothetical protein PKD15_04800 [Candidatus Saccharibacteria bacterium]|nr:hypothetical protein [Candidatus Saccharibacteria bacterium]